MQFSPDGYWMWNGTQWVPNPYRQMVAPPAENPYESARFRASMATLFLIVNAVVAGLGTSWDFVNISYVQTPNPDQTFTALWALSALAVILVVYATYIPAVVFFCMWLHRVVRNMAALGSPDRRWSPGWSVGLCFIPFANLAFPILAVLDAWRGSDLRSRWINTEVRRTLGVPPLMIGWWSLWLVAQGAARVAYFLARSNDTGMKVTSSIFDFVNAATIIGAAVLAIFVVRDLTRRQDKKQEMIATGQLV